jgi:hypothetical protein
VRQSARKSSARKRPRLGKHMAFGTLIRLCAPSPSIYAKPSRMNDRQPWSNLGSRRARCDMTRNHGCSWYPSRALALSNKSPSLPISSQHSYHKTPAVRLTADSGPFCAQCKGQCLFSGSIPHQDGLRPCPNPFQTRATPETKQTRLVCDSPFIHACIWAAVSSH